MVCKLLHECGEHGGLLILNARKRQLTAPPWPDPRSCVLSAGFCYPPRRLPATGCSARKWNQMYVGTELGQSDACFRLFADIRSMVPPNTGRLNALVQCWLS